MMLFFTCMVAFAGFWVGGILGAISNVVVFWLLIIASGFAVEFIRMHKYRDEYLACTEAVLANSEEMADQVNAWTVHYYVHKAFHMSSDNGNLKMGYYLSVRDRPRGKDTIGSFDPNIGFYP